MNVGFWLALFLAMLALNCKKSSSPSSGGGSEKSRVAQQAPADPKDNPQLRTAQKGGEMGGAKASLLRGIKAAHDFSLKDFRGNSFQLSSAKGEVLFVHFWAKWCPPCIDELPVLVDVAKKLQGLPFRMVMVSLDDNWEDAHAILPSEGLPSNVISVLDSEQEVAKNYGSYQFPETYFISKQFRIVTKWIGPQDWNDSEFVSFLKKLIAQ